VASVIGTAGTIRTGQHRLA